MTYLKTSAVSERNNFNSFQIKRNPNVYTYVHTSPCVGVMFALRWESHARISRYRQRIEAKVLKCNIKQRCAAVESNRT